MEKIKKEVEESAEEKMYSSVFSIAEDTLRFIVACNVYNRKVREDEIKTVIKLLNAFVNK